jgi:hypothetical protein
MSTEKAAEEHPVFEIPKKCKAGVVVNEGPDFYVVSCRIGTVAPNTRRFIAEIYSGSSGCGCARPWCGRSPD